MSSNLPFRGDGLVQQASTSSTSTVKAGLGDDPETSIEPDEAPFDLDVGAHRLQATKRQDDVASIDGYASSYRHPHAQFYGSESPALSGFSTPSELHSNAPRGNQSDTEAMNRMRPTRPAASATHGRSGSNPSLVNFDSTTQMHKPNAHLAPFASGSIPMGLSSSQMSATSSDGASLGQQVTSSLAGPNPAPGNLPPFDMRLQPPPPGYHTHDFPSTPPALDFGNQRSPFNEAFERQLQLQDAMSSPPPPDFPPPPIDAAGTEGGNGQAAAGAGGGRFPRWRGWLEKRALERHYARMDAAAGVTPGDETVGRGNLTVQPPIRKKSWGTGVNDPDAIEDELEAASSGSSSGDEDGLNTHDPSNLPPLHIHHYGSRFLPHLHSQPLCSVLLELPPAPAIPGTLRTPMRPRQVVLIGTADGLFLFQKPVRRRRKRQQPGMRGRGPANAALPTSSQEAMDETAEEVKCIHVWSGLGIYQMCVLSSNEGDASSNPLTSSPRPRKGGSGILLALTAPVTGATSSYLPKPLVQLSAHAGTVFESVTSSSGNGLGTSSRSSHGHGTAFADSTDGIAAANFGCAAGGGPGRVIPPGGTGSVRMWNLEALKKVLLYALDHESPKLPMDLVGERTASKEKKTSLASMLKKAFAKEKNRGDRDSKNAGHGRRGGSDGVGVVDPLPADIWSPSYRQGSPGYPQRNFDERSQRSSGPSLELGREMTHSSLYSDNHSVESLNTGSFKDERDGASLMARDPDLATALALALSSVPITAPSSGASSAGSAHTAQGSYMSLFGSDAYGPAGTRPAHSKGKDKDVSSSATGRGVLFFTVHEAGPDTKGTGTWYLALATSKSVMVYEAVPAKRGGGRSWAWMKELYAPFAIKSIAFAPALVADTALAAGSASSAPAPPGPGASMRLKVSSADQPLSASPRGPASGSQGAKRSLGGYSSILKPYHSLGGAAPSSWHRADLSVLVSFGRRSVVIRLSDSNVREFELMPLADVVAASPGGGPGGHTHLALLPSQVQNHASPAIERAQRPHSIVSLAMAQGAGGSGQSSSRAAAGDRSKEHSSHEPKASKHNWVGFTALQAQIRVRQHLYEAEAAGGHGRSRSSVPQQLDMGRMHGVRPPRPASYAPPAGRPLPGAPPSLAAMAAQQDKALPAPPAPQSLSFDRRSSRQHFDQASRMAYEAVQADSSSGSDEDYEGTSSRPARGYSLHDVVAPPGGRLSVNGSRRTSRPRPRRSETPDFFTGTDLVSVKMALVSRGSITQVLPLPLPVDLARPLPLAVLQWTDSPSSVSGWARVLGIERARSSGPVSVDQLRQGPRSPVGPGAGASRSRPSLISRNSSSSLNKGNVIGIHVGITVIAFLASRVEMKRVSFKTEAVVNFDLHRNAELELVPLVPPASYERRDRSAPATGPPRPHSGHSRSRNSIFGSDHANGCWHGPSSSTRPFSHLSTSSMQTTATDSTTGADAETVVSEAGGQAWADVELEYLCGNLLTVNPIDLDASAAGSEAAIFRQSGAEIEGRHGDASNSQVLRELAGDGGVVAFDWRGAEDYRIFCVGAQG